MGVLLYGIFVVLFLIAMHLLHHRRTAPGRRPLVVLTVAMALLATTQFSLHLVSASLALRLLQTTIQNGPRAPSAPLSQTEHLYWVLVLTQDIVLVTNTVLTDGLFVYRCYLVWGRPRKIFLVLPILVMLATLATGYVTSYDEDYINGPYNGPYHFDPRIVFTLNLVTNFTLMSLTAGRIWWATRAQRVVLGHGFTPMYHAAIAIILESGAIYCCGVIFQVIGLTLQDSYSISTPVYLSHGTIGQLVNIAPTLIVVRVGMGHAGPTESATSISRVPVRLPQPLRFARAERSDGDMECDAGESGIQLEDGDVVSRK
ncbi:hypothetical protein B0H11DRAFT_1963763 [Mycena galericulata]|nr:hypothetical protein B0H11DRAFT_1963763 [Mycena galericulata]